MIKIIYNIIIILYIISYYSLHSDAQILNKVDQNTNGVSFSELDATAESTLQKLNDLIGGDLDIDDKKKKEEEASKQAQAQAAQIAAAAAQQQAYVDAMRFQALQYQQRLRHKHHRKHHHHHKHHKHHHTKKKMNKNGVNKLKSNLSKKHKRHRRRHHKHHRHHKKMPRFQQMYPGMLQMYGGYYPMNPMMYGNNNLGRNMYMNPYMKRTQKIDDEDDEDEDEEETDSKKNKNEKKNKQQTNLQPRFRQVNLQQQNAPMQAPSLLEYGDPYNTGRLVGMTHQPQERQNGDVSNAYGPPLDNPKLAASHHAPASGKIPPSPYQMQYQGHPPTVTRDVMRFRQTLATNSRQRVGHDVNVASDNPNPTGVPLPFYAPNQAPPPAPNQVPAPTSMVQGVYPMQMQQENSGQLPPAGPGMVQNAGLNTATVNFSPLGTHSDLNAYPFSSFLEMDSNIKENNQPFDDNGILRKVLDHEEHKIIHPIVYHLATHPLSSNMRTELTDEHMEPFPLLE